MDVPDVDKLTIWCQYWVIIALINVAERIVDPFVAWVPLYGEIKLAFIIYLWHPKTQVSQLQLQNMRVNWPS
ncbi:hypothetical protein L7F22_060308 [Adiantum nelumboides]|nr:hypothetical protein [Adiantum nelumboides]